MKKLEWARKIVELVGHDLNKLKHHGFKKVYTDSASGRIWIHRSRRLVVKSPYLIATIVPKHAIPTLKFKCRMPGDYNTHVVIQPLAQLKRRRLAKIRIIDAGSSVQDLKESNVAWYRGRAVLIDW